MALNVIVKSNLGNDFALDTVNKKVHVNVDADTLLRDSATGILSAKGKVTNLTWDNVTKVITYVNENNVNQTIDLSQFTTDINVSGGTFDPVTTVLTLTQDDGGPDIDIDLAALARSSTIDSSTVAFDGDGSSGDPLTATVKVSATAGNSITVNSDGLYVAAQEPLVPLATSSATVAIDGVTNEISATVKVSATANNIVAVNADGLYVPKAPVQTVADTGSVDLTLSGAGALTASVVVDPVAGNLLTSTASGVKVAAATAFDLQLVDAFDVHVGWARTGTSSSAV